MRWLAIAILVLSLLVVSGGGDPGEAVVRVDHIRGCDATNRARAFHTTPADARLGRAALVSFRRLFENAREDSVYTPEPGVRVLKAALVFPGRRDLTLAVPRSHQAVLRLQYDDPRSHGHSSVRFRACGTRGTGYPGALIYTGPWPACVPLHVSLGGRWPQRHLLSLGAGSCQARR